MEPTARPRRSALYMPASNPRAIEKARTLPCDVVILDLEDAVAPDAKPAARDAAVAAVKAGGFGRREVVIRVNALGTPWAVEDLAAASEAAPDAVLAPKISSADDVDSYSSFLSTAPGTQLWAMIETCPAMFQLADIARAAERSRLAAFVMGVNDLAKEMHARQTPDRAAFLPFLAMSVAAARSAGLVILDGVHNEIDDLQALESVCRQGADLGFDGKSVIHPTHIDIANRVFSPPAEELSWARAVVAAFALPENQGKGALRVEGRLAEHLHLDQCRRLIATAQAIEASEAAA